jgi:hypothetical protein
MRTIFEFILIGAILWLLLEKLNPSGASASTPAAANFNEAPGSVKASNGYLNESGKVWGRGATPAKGGCGCGG